MNVLNQAGGKNWTLYHADVFEAVHGVPSASVDYSIFSPPFASLYTYSNSDRDAGNCRTHDVFYEQFRYLVPELFRVTKPGRLVSFHCMNLPTSKVRDGVIGISDFRGRLVKEFTDAGWIFHSEVVIWKDPVTAMQRTKALGLLHKQIKKDSCMSRQSIPDFLVNMVRPTEGGGEEFDVVRALEALFPPSLLTMRKDGENEERVSHTDESFPVSVWQRYASPVWMDINPSRTLQYMSAREDEDERHLCPLQLDVIERAMKLWSNPGDTVLSPFAGIGSEGHVALTTGRKFVGFELKKSYYEQNARNLAASEPTARGAQTSLF